MSQTVRPRHTFREHPSGVGRFRPRGGLPYAFLSRLLDLVLGLTGTALAVPIVVVAAAAARISTGGSAFFTQTRVGRGNRLFTVIKIRTLAARAPQQTFKKEGEALATPLGAFLRKYKIDELPQLLNVVKGEMSIVGPRPEMPFIVEAYDILEQTRLLTKPGLTGLWQLSRARERLIHLHIEYDLFYLANRSIGFDLWLVWRTLLLLVLGRQTKVRMAAQRWERDPTWRALVPDRGRVVPRRRGPLLSRVWMIASALLVVLAAAPGVAMAVLAREDLDTGAAALLKARDSFRVMDVTAARSSAQEAEAAFSRANGKLGSVVSAPIRVIPILGRNFEVIRALGRSGAEVSAAADRAVVLIDLLPSSRGKLVPPWRDGSLDLEPFRKAAVPVEEVRNRVSSAARIVQESPHGFLIPPIARARAEAIDALAQAEAQAEVASAATLLLPQAFGADEPRTWLIGAENTAELRGRGGYLGSLGILRTEEGKLKLGRFTATEQLPTLEVDLGRSVPREYGEHYWKLAALTAWQNLTMSPHFPSGASLLLDRLEASAGITADGIVSIDPTGLGYLLEVTGPVEVDGLPEPIDAGNIDDWALNRAYFQFEGSNRARRETLADVAQIVWGRLIGARNLDMRKVTEALGRAFAERRLVLYSRHPGEQALIRHLGMGGGVADPPGDYLMVVGQNLGENKMDYYLERSISYRGTIRSDGDLNARLDIEVTNAAPAGQTLPGYIGGERPRLQLSAGTARSYLTVFVPEGSTLLGVSLEGSATNKLNVTSELGKTVFAIPLDVKAGETRRIQLRYLVPDVLVEGRYLLTTQNQATVRPDTFSARVQVPGGSAVSEVDGFEMTDSLEFKGALVAERELSARIDLPALIRLRNLLGSVIQAPAIGGGR